VSASNSGVGQWMNESGDNRPTLSDVTPDNDWIPGADYAAKAQEASIRCFSPTIQCSNRRAPGDVHARSRHRGAPGSDDTRSCACSAKPNCGIAGPSDTFIPQSHTTIPTASMASQWRGKPVVKSS
jgi:hypothetical protein